MSLTAQRSDAYGARDGPLLSVIVPTYNRAPVVAMCLDALFAQDLDPRLFEALVSDDGSADDTRRTVARFVDRAGPQIRYLHQSNQGANAARNRALREAKGKIVLLINDDTIATPSMLSEHLAVHRRAPADTVAVLGRVTVSPRLPPSRLAPLHLDRAFANLEDGAVLDWKHFFTCNVSLKKSLLDRGGMFEERMRYHEDLELSERLASFGLEVVYNAKALGYHEHYLGEKEFLAVARREARSLAVWARISPHVRPKLGELGYEPTATSAARLKHRLADLAINRYTLPLWLQAARRCPERLRGVYLRLYNQIYLSVRRAHLRRELRCG